MKPDRCPSSIVIILKSAVYGFYSKLRNTCILSYFFSTTVKWAISTEHTYNQFNSGWVTSDGQCICAWSIVHIAIITVRFCYKLFVNLDFFSISWYTIGIIDTLLRFSWNRICYRCNKQMVLLSYSNILHIGQVTNQCRVVVAWWRRLSFTLTSRRFWASKTLSCTSFMTV